MADKTIREMILTDLEAALKAITVASGYHFNAKGVFRAGEVPIEMQDPPEIYIRDDGDTSVRHLRWAYEASMSLVIIARSADYSKQEFKTELSRLKGDIEKKAHEDPYWGGLAVTTLMGAGSGVDLSQATSPYGQAVVALTIVYRCLASNPYKLAPYAIP